MVFWHLGAHVVGESEPEASAEGMLPKSVSLESGWLVYVGVGMRSLEVRGNTEE